MFQIVSSGSLLGWARQPQKANLYPEQSSPCRISFLRASPRPLKSNIFKCMNQIYLSLNIDYDARCH